MAFPTIGVQLVQTLIGVAEIYFVSYLGTDALAGVATVFPVQMIMVMVAAGGLGGGVASSVARALGANQPEDVEAIIGHAFLLALSIGALFTVGMLVFGPDVYRALGAEGDALKAASGYSFWISLGAIPLWLVNLMAAALRGAGNFRVPALVTIAGSAVLVVLSPALVFGFGPIPGMGVAGAGLAVAWYYLGSAIVLLRYLVKGAGGLQLRRVRMQGRYFHEILRVGFPAAVNSVQPNVVVLVVTAAVGVFGVDALAGYGVASRLDFVLVPIIFGMGTSVVTMVGTCMGAGKLDRAKRVAWVGAFLGFAFAQTVGLIAAVWPELWLKLFSHDDAVLAVGHIYLRAVGPVYGGLGVGMLLAFAAQGSGKMFWPFVAMFVRMVIAAGIGWIAVTAWGLGLHGLFLIVGAALLLFGAIGVLAAQQGWIWPPKRA